MKKSSALLFILIIIASIGLVFCVLHFFVFTNKTTETPVPTETAYITEPAPAPETEFLQLSATEGMNPVETVAIENNIIDITSEHSNALRIETTGPIEYEDPANVPEGYRRIHFRDEKAPVWGYMNQDGEFCLRVYGTRWRKINNVNRDKVTGYFDVQIKKKGSVLMIDNASMEPIETEKERMATPSRKSIDPPESFDTNKYTRIDENLYVCVTKSGNTAYRTFADVNGVIYLFDCDEAGSIRPGSLPVCYEEESYNLVENPDTSTSNEMITTYPVRLAKNGPIVEAER